MLQFLKRSLFTLLFLGMAFHMSAQDQQYFVYIQSERSQPFYVRYDGKLIPSSDRGYLILSKMPAGTASLRIGFAKSEAPERQFLVKVSGPADQGFLLKQDAERGTSLFNLQTYAVIRPSADKQPEAVAAAEAPAPQPEVAQETPPATTAPETAVAAVPETVPAPASADTPLIPAAPVAAPVSEDEQKQAMMSSLKKDLDSTFPASSGVAVGPGTRPVKQTNSFSKALDKVVSDDRPDDIELEQPKAPVATAPVADNTPKADPAAEGVKPPKRRRRQREPLTEEEKALASSIIAEENKTAAEATTPGQEQAPAAPVTDVTAQPSTPAPVQDAPVASAPAQAPSEVVKEDAPVATKKDRKQKKKKTDDPAFIDFMDTGGHQAPPAATVETPAATATPESGDVVAAPAETGAAKKKKRTKLSEKIDTIDTSERPNNVVNDPTGYEVTDLSIDHPKESKKDKKKKKTAAEDGAVADVAAPVAGPVAETPAADSKSSLKMINSDCGKVMDDETFRKVMKKYAASKDDDAMIESFRKQTKGYCLESSQIRTLAQMLSTDESKYRFLDQAYPKAYHSDEFATMESLLSDRYYKGRFKAMLHK